MKSGSTSLAKIMYWRNMKLKIIIAVLILAVLLYILVPIISHFKSDDDNSNNNNNNNGEDWNFNFFILMFTIKFQKKIFYESFICINFM